MPDRPFTVQNLQAKGAESAVNAPAGAFSGLVPGASLDRHELLCPIGEGGMTSVWAGRQRGKVGFERLVAIKTLLPQFSRDGRFRRIFLNEAKIGSKIDHPNVARVLDFGEVGDQLYLAIEWIDGESLEQILGRANIRIILQILADVCAGLQAVHEAFDAAGAPRSAGCGNISPENILVDCQGVSKLIDFGMATTDSAAEYMNIRRLKGRLSSVAPELSVDCRADRRADIWSVGAILHRFLGGVPVSAVDPLKTRPSVGAGLALSPLSPRVPLAVAAVVERALMRDPEDRFQTARDMRAALLSAMGQLRVPTKVDDVAWFMTTHMQDNLRARRTDIASALLAASDRMSPARLNSYSEPPDPEVDDEDTVDELPTLVAPLRWPEPPFKYPSVRPSRPPPGLLRTTLSGTISVAQRAKETGWDLWAGALAVCLIAATFYARGAAFSQRLHPSPPPLAAAAAEAPCPSFAPLEQRQPVPPSTAYRAAIDVSSLPIAPPPSTIATHRTREGAKSQASAKHTVGSSPPASVAATPSVATTDR